MVIEYKYSMSKISTDLSSACYWLLSDTFVKHIKFNFSKNANNLKFPYLGNLTKYLHETVFSFPP